MAPKTVADSGARPISRPHPLPCRRFPQSGSLRREPRARMCNSCARDAQMICVSLVEEPAFLLFEEALPVALACHFPLKRAEHRIEANRKDDTKHLLLNGAAQRVEPLPRPDRIL